MPKSPPPQLGDLDRQVTWQRLNPSPTLDAYGQPVRGSRYTDLALLWVSMKQVSGREAAYAERMKIEATDVFETIFPGVILVADRFRYIDPHTGASRYFNITNANDLDERSFSIQVFATEVKNPSEAQL